MFQSKLKGFLLASVSGMILMTAAPASADVVIVVNKANTQTTMSSSDLKRIFLGKKTAFSDGSSAVAVYQVTNSGVRATFDQNYLGKNSAQMNSFWSKKMFSGEGVPPKELASDLAVLEFVSNNPGAIGYLDESAVNAAVSTVTIK